MDALGKLFSSNAIVRIMRLFLLHPDTPFEGKDIIQRSKVTAGSLRTEISILSSAGFVKKKTFFKDAALARGRKKGTPKKKRVSGWILNPDFPHLYALKLLLLNPDSVNKKKIVQKIAKTGKVKLIVLSGIFLREEGSRIDILVVGDGINKKSVEGALRHVESEVGKELRYAVMNTDEFHYRIGMCDKFVRDIFDYPHEKLVDKIGISG